ncbi:MAG: permease-like cell division protein FtsX [Elusimicrobia bacterium]|nr:permease-like cell division protein FtsX [Candidatus Liberimonas magnetica]
MKIDNILTLLIISLVLSLSGLGLNAYYLANSYSAQLSSKNQVAVFIKKQNKTESLEVIKEKIINLNGISEVELKSPEDILKDMPHVAPIVNDIMILGENPFSPYFIVETSIINLSYIMALKDKLMSFEGVEEVKFDENLVSMIEGLDNIIQFYKFVWKAVLIIAGLFIFFKYIILLIKRALFIKEMVYILLQGLASGLFGWLVYKGFSHYFSAPNIIQIPSGYIAYFLLNGLILSLAIKKD